VKWCNVRQRNFARGRVPCVCRTRARYYVDRGRHWEETRFREQEISDLKYFFNFGALTNFLQIKILKHCAYTCCGESQAAASFDFGCIAGVRRTSANNSKAACSAGPQRGKAVEQMACDRGRNGRERIRSNARHPDRAPQRRDGHVILNKMMRPIGCISLSQNNYFVKLNTLHVGNNTHMPYYGRGIM